MRALALAAVLALSGGAAAAQPESAAERGLRIAQESCSRCHAIGMADTGPLPEAPPFRELHERYPVEHLAEALVEGIVTGHADMPEFRFAPQAADDLIAYLRGLE